jgi:hypothetical protein
LTWLRECLEDMSGTKYINVEGRGMKWHLMLKGVVCVANRVNGSKDGCLRFEWDDIQRYGVIREQRVEVFEPVGGGRRRRRRSRRRGFGAPGGWPTTHPRVRPPGSRLQRFIRCRRADAHNLPTIWAAASREAKRGTRKEPHHA